MGGGFLLPGWDTFVLAVPILGFLAMVMFRLDERCAAPRGGRGRGRRFCDVGGSGLSDPDGRPWRMRPVEGQLIPAGGSGQEPGMQGSKKGTGSVKVLRGYVIET